jgi:arylsulfatase
LRRHKTWVHEGGISTPLIVHWPAGITARGELRHNPAHFIDVVPTVLEVTGARKPQTIGGQSVPLAPGKSLVSSFQKDGTVTHDYLWWMHEDNRAIRVGDWKLVALAKGPWELYNLATDRCESQNLAGKYPDKVRELSALWEKQTEASRQLALTDLPATAPNGEKANPKTK